MRKKKSRNKILKAGKQITWQDQKNRILNWQQRMLMTIPIYIMCMCAQSLSHVRLFATQAPVAHQAPLSMRLFRQGYWSGLPFPPPGDLPNPGIEPGSPVLQGDSLSTELQGKPTYKGCHIIFPLLCLTYFTPHDNF